MNKIPIEPRPLRGSVRQTFEPGDCVSTPLGQGIVMETYELDKPEGQIRCTVKIDRPSGRLDNREVDFDTEHLTHLTRSAGYQKHPSTMAAHYFPENSFWSACKRETRTDGQVVDDPGMFPCGHCIRALSKQTGSS